MKKGVRILLYTFIVYIVLLLLLVAVESGDPAASIRTIWDAVWFSLITMTTVGYGDLSPVTPLGRILGLVFALCSIGILTALIGIGLQLIAGQFIPSLRLRLSRRHSWYVFSAENADAAALAEDLRKQDKDCLFLLPSQEKKGMAGPDVIRMDLDTDRLIRLRGGQRAGLSLFFMDSDPWKNYAAALKSAVHDIPVYCMTDVPDDDPADGLHLFSRTEALGRSYWKEYPLKAKERCVVLIGCGRSGCALLERALLTNVFEPGRGVEYHVFCDSVGFASIHPQIVRALASREEEDRLIIHSQSWMDDPALLARADRIIFCLEEDSNNLEAYETLRTWVSTPATIHVRLTEAIPSLLSFGERDKIITAEFVMKDALNRRAAALNEIYNANSPNGAKWEDLGWFLRQSNIAVADHLAVKVRYLLEDESILEVTPEICARAYERFLAASPEEKELMKEMEHRRWMRFHWMYNWQYAPERDNDKRQHPLLIPYGELETSEQDKDSYAWEMLGKLAGLPGKSSVQQQEEA